MSAQRLRHGRLELSLHRLRAGEGPHLLLLHELGGCATQIELEEVSDSWQGSIWGVDFCGHGASDVPAGGGYSAEWLLADADVALAELDHATLLGYGLGAYIALLLAGARPQNVDGAILAPGRGLNGGGPHPCERPRIDAAVAAGTPDPAAIVCFEQDIRPPGYATLHARQAGYFWRQRERQGCPLRIDPAAVVDPPPWLSAVATHESATQQSVALALRELGAQALEA